MQPFKKPNKIKIPYKAFVFKNGNTPKQLLAKRVIFWSKEKLLQWIQESYEHECKQFNTVANSLQYHLDNILNFFNNRNTNANTESFNAKTKLFRANLRSVYDIPFFLFRLKNLFP